MKVCRSCGKEKEIEDFYVHSRMADGHLNKCIECVKQRVTIHRNANLERIRAYDKVRNMLPHKVENRKIYVRTWRDVNQDKYRAESAVNNAIRNGRLIKPDKCERCGNPGILHGHHEDYSKPLNVEWLCVPCHADKHKGAKHGNQSD